MSALEAIVYERGALKLLDQLKLPLETTYVDVEDCDACWRAIKDMNVRGAPAIAIAAALALDVMSATLWVRVLAVGPAKSIIRAAARDDEVGNRESAKSRISATSRIPIPVLFLQFSLTANRQAADS